MNHLLFLLLELSERQFFFCSDGRQFIAGIPGLQKPIHEKLSLFSAYLAVSGIAIIFVEGAAFPKAKIPAGMTAGGAARRLIWEIRVSAIRAHLYPALRIHREHRFR